MKTCTACNAERELSEFPRNGKYLRSKCKACTAERHLKYKQDNSEAYKDVALSYSRANFAEARNRVSEWQKNNKGAKNSTQAKRRASKKNATPAWLTEEQHDDIKAMYVQAKKFEKLCNISYHVDHIVPLSGKDVCGLHVPWNLQILTASANISKGNSNHEEALRG